MHPANEGHLDDIVLLQPGCTNDCDDTTLDNTDLQEHQEQPVELVNDSLDELDKPVLIDVDPNILCLRGPELNYASRSRGGDGYYSADDNSSMPAQNADYDQLYVPPSTRDASDPDYRPLHVYDPVYVPRHDAASMARRVDEASYVRTPRVRRNVDPYEEVQLGMLSQPHPATLPQAQPHQPVTLPEDVGPAPVAPPRIASAGRSAVMFPGRERRPLPPIQNDAAESGTRALSLSTEAGESLVPVPPRAGVEEDDCPYETINVNR